MVFYARLLGENENVLSAVSIWFDGVTYQAGSKDDREAEESCAARTMSPTRNGGAVSHDGQAWQDARRGRLSPGCAGPRSLLEERSSGMWGGWSRESLSFVCRECRENPYRHLQEEVMGERRKVQESPCTPCTCPVHGYPRAASRGYSRRWRTLHHHHLWPCSVPIIFTITSDHALYQAREKRR
jgi:hypothetical protein